MAPTASGRDHDRFPAPFANRSESPFRSRSDARAKKQLSGPKERVQNAGTRRIELAVFADHFQFYIQDERQRAIAPLSSQKP